MITQKVTLPVGIEIDGVLHRDVVLRPQKVRDSVEAMEDERAAKNESYLGLMMQAKQIVSFGTLKTEQINADLLMELFDLDMAEMMGAARKLQERLKTFRDSGTQAA
jgi:hypothetical protein